MTCLKFENLASCNYKKHNIMKLMNMQPKKCSRQIYINTLFEVISSHNTYFIFKYYNANILKIVIGL